MDENFPREFTAPARASEKLEIVNIGFRDGRPRLSRYVGQSRRSVYQCTIHGHPFSQPLSLCPLYCLQL